MKLFGALLALMLAVGAVSFWAWRAAPVSTLNAISPDSARNARHGPSGRRP